MQRDIALQQQSQAQLLEPIILRQSGLEKVFIPGEGDPAVAAQRADLERQIAEARRNIQNTRGNLPAAFAASRSIAGLEQRLASLPQTTPGRFEIRETSSAKLKREQEESLIGLRGDLERLTIDRSTKALKGELPIDEGLLRDLASREKLTRETLLRQLGPGFETSTPGIEALREFETFRSSTLDRARRGDIQQILPQTQRLGLSQQLPADAFIGTLGSPFNAFGGAAQGFGALQAPFQRQRDQQFASSQAAFQANRGRGAGIGSLLGTVGGIIAAPFTGGLSVAAGGALGGALGGGIGGLFD